MTTRALLTVNFNGALCDNSRQSMREAADRWGAGFIEWSERTAPKYRIHPAALKCAAFEDTSCDDIFILDADTVISASCPSPFEAFADASFVAVANGNPERFGDIEEIRSCERFEWRRLQEREPRLAGAEYQPGRYWNSGMMLARRGACGRMFKLALDVCHINHGLGWIDQTVLVAAASVCNVTVRFADESWNFIHPEDLPGFPHMNGSTYIWHFAGSPGREHVLPIIEWK